MKKYNDSSDKKVLFTGFDLQDIYTPIRAIKKEFNNNPSIIEKLDELRGLLANFRDPRKKERKAEMNTKDKETTISIISAIKKEISSSKSVRSDTEWINQYVRLLEQNTELNEITRDKFMAENVLWIKNHNPDSKIIHWAHNTHINKASTHIGKYLSD